MRTILSLDSAAGIVSVGSPASKLPGILESITINGKLLFENAQIEGRSGSVKIVQGWEDSTIAIDLLVLDDTERKKTRFEFLKEITSIFKQVKDGMPDVYVLQHPALEAWQVRSVLFSDLKSTEKRGRQQIMVSLSFVEYDPLVATMQKRQEGTKKKREETTAPVNPLVPDKTRRGLGELSEKVDE
jgi:hypothetical protein